MSTKNEKPEKAGDVILPSELEEATSAAMAFTEPAPVEGPGAADPGLIEVRGSLKNPNPGPGYASKSAVHVVIWQGQGVRYRYRKVGNEIVKEIDFEFEPKREAPNPNRSHRVIRAKSVPGLSQDYTFGPLYPFASEMTAEDARLLLDHPTVGSRFFDVTGEEFLKALPVRKLDDQNERILGNLRTHFRGRD